MDQLFIEKNQSASMHLGSSTEQVNRLNNTDQHGHARLSPVPISVVSINVPSQLLPPAVEPNLHVTRPKKHNSATLELMAWHEELKQVSERLRDIMVAELDWAQATNGSIEKVEKDAELVEVLPTMVCIAVAVCPCSRCCLPGCCRSHCLTENVHVGFLWRLGSCSC